MFSKYEEKYKALADKHRLKIINELCKNGQTCVCNLCNVMEMPQSKLSYHLKILLDAGFIKKDKDGTWNYYDLDKEELKKFMSDDLCMLINLDNSKDCECT